MNVVIALIVGLSCGQPEGWQHIPDEGWQQIPDARLRCAARLQPGYTQTKPPTKPRSKAATKKPVPPKPSSEFDRVAKDAEAAREANRLADAIPLYQKALALKADWLEGLWGLGVSLYELDRYAEARETFTRLIAAAPRHGPAYAFRGLCAYQVKAYDRALDDLQRAGAFGFGDHKELLESSRYHLGVLLNRSEQYENAYGTLAPFAHEGNDNPRVIEAFGMSALRIPLVPPELPSDKRPMVMMAGRAMFYQARRHSGAARRAFEELELRYPEAPNVHYAFGAFLLTEDPDQSLVQFKKELEISPAHVEAMLQIAFEHIKRSDYQTALPYAEKAVETSPTSFPARKAFGEALLGAGDIAKAIDQLEVGAKIAPDSPGVRFALARAYARAGRGDDAAKQRAEFLRLDKIYRTQKSGAQAVGGIEEQAERPPI